jgi:hypothetical protein
MFRKVAMESENSNLQTFINHEKYCIILDKYINGT